MFRVRLTFADTDATAFTADTYSNPGNAEDAIPALLAEHPEANGAHVVQLVETKWGKDDGGAKVATHHKWEAV